ncbi:MAG: hypothetical protein Tsb0013_02560 [Phycisphaerales bacterium]
MKRIITTTACVLAIAGSALATPPVLTDVGVDVGSFGESMAIKLGADIASILPAALGIAVIFLAIVWLMKLMKRN